MDCFLRVMLQVIRIREDCNEKEIKAVSLTTWRGEVFFYFESKECFAFVLHTHGYVHP
jgi:hypothetical protein